MNLKEKRKSDNVDSFFHLSLKDINVQEQGLNKFKQLDEVILN